MLRFELVDAVSDGAHEPNEDAWGKSSAAAWVIDGASDVDRQPTFDPASDAALIASFAADVMHRQLADKQQVREVDLRRALETTAGRFKERLGDTPPDVVLPSAAVTAIGIHDRDHLSLVGLGDVTAVVEQPNGVMLFSNPKSLQHELRKVADPNYTPEIGRAQARERRLAAMNREGGYWILSTDPTAARHARATLAPVDPGAYVLMATDGFARVVEVFKFEPDWASVLSQLRSGTRLADLLDRLRTAEASDPERERYPRVTTSDDATAVLLRLVA